MGAAQLQSTVPSLFTQEEMERIIRFRQLRNALGALLLRLIVAVLIIWTACCLFEVARSFCPTSWWDAVVSRPTQWVVSRIRQ
jgi:hypothetical protein